MKKIFINIFSAGLMLLSVASASALNLPVKDVHGKLVYYYTTVKGDKLGTLAEKIGVSRSQLVEYNPQVADGVIPGTVITFPVTFDAKVLNGYYVTEYSVGNNESIYGVANLFKVPMDRLIEFNPGATTGIKGMTLTIPLYKAEDNASAVDTHEVAPKQQKAIPAGCFPYLVKVGDTLERIALENGMTPEAIRQVNPDTDFMHLQVGEMIYVPINQSLEPSEKRIGKFSAVPSPAPVQEELPVYDVDAEKSVEECVQEETANTSPAYPFGEPGEVMIQQCDIVQQQPLSVAVMLPFMLDNPGESRTGALYTEFYRGFMMGLEEMSHAGTPVTVSAYDTQGSDSTVSALLTLPELKNVNLIIAPDNQQHLKMMAERAQENDNSYLLNIFAVKDDSYLTNPSVIQANIPHPAMYRKAVESFIEQYADRVPVFISRVGGSGEKIEFTDSLKSRLNSLGREYKEVNFKNFLGRDNLEDLNPDSLSYVFVPGSGSRQEFTKFAPALKNLRNASMNHNNVVLYGYPEYIMFRGDNLDLLHQLNTTIYSRYLSLPDFPEVKTMAARYRSLYGEEMEEAVPMQALIGYDTAKFVITSLRNNEGSFSDSSMDYDGVQMGYSLEEVTDGGLVNENLYLIEYRPGGNLSKTRL